MPTILILKSKSTHQNTFIHYFHRKARPHWRMLTFQQIFFLLRLNKDAPSLNFLSRKFRYHFFLNCIMVMSYFIAQWWSDIGITGIKNNGCQNEQGSEKWYKNWKSYPQRTFYHFTAHNELLNICQNLGLMQRLLFFLLIVVFILYFQFLSLFNNYVKNDIYNNNIFILLFTFLCKCWW